MNVRASGYDDLCHAPNSPLNRDTFLVLEKSRRLESCRSRQQYQHRSLFGIFGCDRSGLFLISGSGACRHVSMNPYRMWVIPTRVALHQKQKILAGTSPRLYDVSSIALPYSM